MMLMNPDIINSDDDLTLQVDVQFVVDIEDHVSAEQLISWANSAYKHALKHHSKTHALNIATSRQQECVIRISDKSESQRLNTEFRNKNKPTNVLSFCYEDINDYLGDIVICLPVVLNEAIQQQKSVHAHFAHLVCHGILHLLGYDHIEQDEAEIMEALESDILNHLSIANPYEALVN